MIKDRAKLQDYLDGWENTNLDYKHMDCARFAAGWAAICTDNDPMSHYKDWDTTTSALKVIKDNGGRLLDAVCASLGAHTPANKLSWGAIACIDQPPFDGLGIVDGDGVICLSPLGGFKRTSINFFIAGWNL